ncbi:MAG: histidine kinase [Bacteroidales bacterium]|nr:histidine kinase [Bacteroidales bacterium]
MKKKQLKETFKHLFFNAVTLVLLLALIPAFIIILIHPVNFQKYQIKLNKKVLNKTEISSYKDLNYDGKQEYIYLNNYTNRTLSMLIYTSDMEHTGQYNSEYYMPDALSRNKIYCEDIDNDSIKEIIYFSQNKDSLFLSIFSYKELKFLLKERFITTIGLNGKHDYDYNWLTSVDINNDNVKEIYFSVIAGYALYPRKLFRYDLAHDSLITSPDVGAKQFAKSFTSESGKLIFLSGSRAADNCHNGFPFAYKDSCVWFFVYDKDLKFITAPERFAGKPSSITDIYKYGENYTAIFINLGTYGENNEILIINPKGKIINRINTPIKSKYENLINLKIGKKYHFFIAENSLDNIFYFEFFPEKQVFKETRLSKKLNGYQPPYIFDIDKDNEDEFFLISFVDNSLYLYRNNLTNEVKVPVDADFRGIENISSKVIDKDIKIIITTKSKVYFYDYFENPNYRFQYLFWIIIYLVSIFFVWLVQLIPKRIEKKQSDLKNKIINLQLKNTQNQLDPHFTFNALNVVASKIYKEDRNTAYDLFERFSRLMRSSLAFSDKIFRPLSDELQFTEDYLEFQKSRFIKVFDYSISVDEDINPEKTEIPKMLIQGFAENCVKHAFKGIQYKGKIIIAVKKEEGETIITIEDNGIGIKQSQINNPVPDSGYGMVTMQEQISLINKLYKKEIVIDVTNKSMNNTSLIGTLISIRL